MGHHRLDYLRPGLSHHHYSLPCERSNDLSNNTDPRLLDIYDGVLDAIVEKLKNPAEVTAADLNAYRAILKDNGITSIRVPGNKLDEAAKATEAFDTSKFPFAVNAPILPNDDPAVKAVGGE